MENIALVTGANGFIGSHLSIALVSRGFKVYGLYRRNTSNNPDFNKLVDEGKIIRIGGDVNTYDFNQLPKVNYIYHIAGKVAVYGKYREFVDTNINATNKLLEYAKTTNVECFTYFSTAAVYGFGEEFIEETSIKKPFNNPYPLTKLRTENNVQIFCKENNMNYVIIRPANVYGEYDYTSSYQIYSRIKKEKMSICANGKYKTCFVYVKNLVDATLLTSLTKTFNNTDYNVSDQNNETLKEYFTCVAKTFNVRAKFINFPSFLAKTVAILVEGMYKILHIKKAPLITKFSIYQNCAPYHFSIKKLNDIGYFPKISQSEGVKNTVDWINSL